MKKILAILFGLAICGSAISQTFEVPKNYSLVQIPDYNKYEPDVLKGIDWLQNTPLGKEDAKRKEAYAFILKWMMGSPTVTIVVNGDIVKFSSENPDLVFIFMAGWTKYSLQTKDFKNQVIGNLKGIEAVIDFYKRNKEKLVKDKQVEKLIKLQEKGKLEKYIAKKIENK